MTTGARVLGHDRRLPGPFTAEHRDGGTILHVTVDEAGDVSVSQEVDGEHTTIELSQRGAAWLREALDDAARSSARRRSEEPAPAEAIEAFKERFGGRGR